MKQATHYYPYGDILSQSTNHGVQKFKYNGKEMDRMYGLDTYDHGARQYNPARITWDRIDPLCQKYYHISPYVYCAGNPIRFIDPDGRRPGDYITEKGELINNDGVNDGRLYVLKTTQKNGFDSYGGAKGAGIDKKTKKSVIKNKDISNNDNFVEVIGPQELRQAVAGKIRDDGNGGTKLDNNREYGITFEKNVDSPTLYTKESPVGDPTTDANISLSMGNNPEVTYVHSHPSGTKYNYKTHKSSRWMQAPSLPDVQNAGQATQYVIGCRDKTIYMYNNQGILATLPLNIFINYQVKR